MTTTPEAAAARCLICLHALRPEDAYRTACDRCGHRIRAMLRELHRQLPLLAASLSRDTTPTQGRPAGRAHAPLPVREDVLSLLGPAAPGTVRDTHGDQSGPAPALAVIYAWAERLAEARDKRLLPYRPGHDYTRYLAAHLPYALTRDWIADFNAELGDLIGRIRAITRTTPQRHPKPAPCPACDAFGLVAEDWQPYTECTACGLLLTANEYADHHARVMPALYRIGLRLALARHTTTEPTP
ncbi:hypothetical protein [Streptomyces sp. NPDC055036]